MSSVIALQSLNLSGNFIGEGAASLQCEEQKAAKLQLHKKQTEALGFEKLRASRLQYEEQQIGTLHGQVFSEILCESIHLIYNIEVGIYHGQIAVSLAPMYMHNLN